MPSILESYEETLLLGKIFWTQAGFEPALRSWLSLAQYNRTMEPLGLTAPNSDLVVMHNLFPINLRKNRKFYVEIWKYFMEVKKGYI
jgi:hypothetical protein